MSVEAVNYKFQYLGALPDGIYDQDMAPSQPDLIKLYRKQSLRYPQIWSIQADFPKSSETFPQKKYCSDFFDLMGLIRESDAIERQQTGLHQRGDDWLLFSRQLRESGQNPDIICPEERILALDLWEYNCMGISFGSMRPVPEYRCGGCNEREHPNPYGHMVNSSIAYIGQTATEYSYENEPAYSWPGNYSWSDRQLDEMLKLGTIQGR